MKMKKATKPTFQKDTQLGLWILFGLIAKVIILYIFAINPDLNENDKEMS